MNQLVLFLVYHVSLSYFCWLLFLLVGNDDHLGCN